MSGKYGDKYLSVSYNFNASVMNYEDCDIDGNA